MHLSSSNEQQRRQPFSLDTMSDNRPLYSSVYWLSISGRVFGYSGEFVLVPRLLLEGAEGRGVPFVRQLVYTSPKAATAALRNERQEQAFSSSSFYSLLVYALCTQRKQGSNVDNKDATLARDALLATGSMRIVICLRHRWKRSELRYAFMGRHGICDFDESMCLLLRGPRRLRSFACAGEGQRTLNSHCTSQRAQVGSALLIHTKSELSLEEM